MDNINQPIPTPQTPDQMHSSFEESNGSKVIPFIIVAVLIVLVGAGSYVLGTKKTPTPTENKVVAQPSPTPIDETTNWKTYSDQKYYYAIKYPNDWILKQTPSGGILISSADSTHDSSVFPKKGAELIVWPNNNPPVTSFDFFVDSQHTINLNNLDATMYEVSGAGIENKGITVAIKQKDNNYLTIDFYYEQSRKEELRKLFDQILSTFKFTDQNQTNNTSYCSPNQLLTQTSGQGAAGTVYVNVTIKNTSNSTCQIIGNNFLTPLFDPSIQNITISHPKQPTMTTFTLTPNQALYSLLTYPNGPQCSSAPKQQPMTLSYTISPTGSITFKNPDGTSLYVQDCTSPTEMSNIQIWPLSDTPITP